MHLIYIDDARDEKYCVFSALVIPADSWHLTFSEIRNFRRELRRTDGIYVYKEFHAWKFVSGRGQISDRIVTKGRRCQLFNESLAFLARQQGVRLMNACFPSKDDARAFEWLLTRINRTMLAWSSYALLICDEGKEAEYTRLARRMARFNPIPSQFGGWKETGSSTKNIPNDRIIEDPFFKPSDQSYMIQFADFCAYALLRRENPVPSKTRYGLDKSFRLLDAILLREATRKDPDGIIRLKKAGPTSATMDGFGPALTIIRHTAKKYKSAHAGLGPPNCTWLYLRYRPPTASRRSFCQSANRPSGSCPLPFAKRTPAVHFARYDIGFPSDRRRRRCPRNPYSMMQRSTW